MVEGEASRVRRLDWRVKERERENYERRRQSRDYNTYIPGKVVYTKVRSGYAAWVAWQRREACAG